MPRRGYRHRERLPLDRTHRPPDQWLPTSWAVVSKAAFPAPDDVKRKVGDANSLVDGAFALPFDTPVIFTGAQLIAGGLGANVEFDLVGSVAALSSGSTTGAVTGAPQPKPAIGPIPAGYRAVVDSIAPLLTDLVGNRADVTPQQLGMTVTWRVRVSGVLASPYDNLQYIVSPWHQLSIRPLLELDQGDILTATVQIAGATPLGLVGQIGIRLRGRLIPWDNKHGRPKTPQGY